MKYIKKYKVFESKLEIGTELQEIIYDISHELRDNNYEVSYQWWQVNIDNAPYMTIRSDIEGTYPNKVIVPRDRARLINKEEVDGVVDRLKDVCKDYGWNLDVWEGEYEYIITFTK